jgi:hypothetical protein
VPEATSSAANTPLPQDHGLLAFSGSRDRLSQSEEFLWLDFLQGLGGWKGFVTGGCVGFDDYVGRTLVEIFPTHQHVVYVPADRTRVAAWWRDPAKAPFVEVREMLPGTTFEDRNRAMVDHAAALVVKPKGPEASYPRSGTWMTINIARSQMKPVINPFPPLGFHL